MPEDNRWTGLDPQQLERDDLPDLASLQSWDVPDPSQDLTDRIAAAVHEDAAPSLIQDLQPRTQDVNPTPTPRSSLLISIGVGFAIAAAVLLAFWVGRASVPSPAELPERAAVALPAPVVAPAAPLPPAVDPPRNTDAPKVDGEGDHPPVPEPATAPSTRKKTPPRPRDKNVGGHVNRDLKNPFSVDDEPIPDVVDNSDDDDDDDDATMKNPFNKRPKPPKSDPKKTSTLKLGTSYGEPPALVSVDGEAVGRTPQSRVRVTPGRHKVVFTWPDKKRSVTKFVTVEAGGTALVRGG